MQDVEIARLLCEASGRSPKIGDGNIAKMVKGVRRVKARLNLTALSCMVDGTSQGPCDELGVFEVRPKHLGKQHLRCCAKHAAKAAWARR